MPVGLAPPTVMPGRPAARPPLVNRGTPPWLKLDQPTPVGVPSLGDQAAAMGQVDAQQGGFTQRKLGSSSRHWAAHASARALDTTLNRPRPYWSVILNQVLALLVVA